MVHQPGTSVYLPAVRPPSVMKILNESKCVSIVYKELSRTASLCAPVGLANRIDDPCPPLTESVRFDGRFHAYLND